MKISSGSVFKDWSAGPIPLLVLLLILPFSGNIYSQNADLVFEQIFLQHGLSQSIVTHIIQDRTGFMWIATEDGLNKFDGYEFKIFRNDPDNPNSPSYNQITALYEDRAGIIWLGTFYGGLDRYDPLNNKFTHYRFDPKDPASISHNNIHVIFEDSFGTLWVGTDDGLNKMERKRGVFTRFKNNPGIKNSLSNNIVRAIGEDKYGVLWIGTDNGLNKFNRDDNSFTIFRNSSGNSKSLSHNEIYSIHKDRSGEIWIGTNGGGLNHLVNPRNGGELPAFISYRNIPGDRKSISNNRIYAIYEDTKGIFWIATNGGGLNIFNKESKIFSHYTHDPLNPSSLSHNEIRTIYEDKSGLIWIGTYGRGINLVNRGRKNFRLYNNVANTPNSLNENIVWSIHEDNSGILWIGTHGGGLNRLDRSKNLYTHYLNNPENPGSLSSNIVRLVFEDRSGNFWVGTHGGGLNKFNKATGRFVSFIHNENDLNSISHNELRSIYQDRSGTIWVGTNGGGLNKMILPGGNSSSPKFLSYRNIPGDSASISNDFIRVIYEDGAGNFWIGTQGGGLNRFDREKNIFPHYRAKRGDKNSIANDYIFAIYEDTRGRLWLGTWGGGLIRFDVKNSLFKNYTVKEGLPSDAVYGILEDERGFLWISTNKGLSKFDADKEAFKNFTVDDGLQNNEFNGGSFFKSRSGEMFFGGIGGFNSFYPSQIKSNQHIPPVVITSFKEMNKEVSFGKPIHEIDELEIPNKNYLFSFEFASLDFNAPHKNRYAYKMDGLDEDWITTTSDRRYAVYTTLSPGRYTFRVKGSNNDGVWNETGTSISILILPPFWKTWWFVLLSLLLAGGLFYFSIKRRMKNVRMHTELRAAHEAQMSIMPHGDPELDSFDISSLCIPASEVGGDFFDYIWMNEDNSTLGIVIGDVSGKGMKSAMNAVMCSGMLISLINDRLPVNEIMTRVNKALFSKTDRKMFTALCFSTIDLKTKKFVFTNAGLNPPLVKSGDEIFSVESQGPKLPLAGFLNTEYKSKSHQLETGDVLFLFTDGITEAENHEKELYGIGNLITLLKTIDTSSLSARKIKEAIFEDVKQFTTHKNQSDDMTLIVIKIL